jgi:hypothetical protein
MLDNNTNDFAVCDEERDSIEQFLKGVVPSGRELSSHHDDSFQKSSGQNSHKENTQNTRKNKRDNLKDFGKKLSDLTFVRLLDPIHIPSYLVEQLKDKLYDIEKFFSYQKIACLSPGPQGALLNPYHFLYAITHEKLRQVKGFCEFDIDILNNSLKIQQFSMDKEYWNRGDAIELLIEKAKKVMKDLDLSRIVWATKNPRFCEKMGFIRSKEAVMIYE